jgi:hypothetical protein
MCEYYTHGVKVVISTIYSPKEAKPLLSLVGWRDSEKSLLSEN